MSKLESRKRRYEEEDLPFVQIALGLTFLFGAVVFAFLVPPGTLVPAFALSIPAAALLGSAAKEVVKRRRALPPPADKERELLEAVRDNGGNITPAEAEMVTTLT